VRYPGFVAVEGIDGAGKSSLVVRLSGALRRRGYVPVQLVEPSYGPFGLAVRELLASGVAITDERLNRLFLADRRDHAARRTRPLLEVARERPEQRIVLVQDRSYYSSQAYQGLHEDAATADIARFESVAVRPDLVILLDVPIEVARARIDDRPRADQDVSSLEVLATARAVYLDLAKRHPHFEVFDGMRPVDDLVDEIASRHWPRLVG
jgi:dTMP kinase